MPVVPFVAVGDIDEAADSIDITNASDAIGIGSGIDAAADASDTTDASDANNVMHGIDANNFES